MIILNTDVEFNLLNLTGHFDKPFAKGIPSGKTVNKTFLFQ